MSLSPPRPSSRVEPSLRETTFEATLPTDLERIRSVRRCVEGLLASEGWSDEDAADVGLVVTELLQNAIEHGSRNDAHEPVQLRCVLPSAGTIIVEASDPGTGKGLASLLARDVTVAPPIDAVRGRGLFLVHRMSKSLERAAAPDGRSLVRVRFCASTPPGAAGA